MMGLLGWAKIRLMGACPEECLTDLAQKGLRFQFVTKTDDVTAIIKVPLNRVEPVCSLASKQMCTAEVLELRGLYPNLIRMKGRLLLFPMLMAVIFLCWEIQSRSWFFTVSGNETVSSYEILQSLWENGVYCGAKVSKMDMDELRNRVLEQIPSLAWITVNTEGPMAEIEVRQRQDKPAIGSDAAPTNLVAAKTGRIERMEITSGTPQVREGDYVQAGQLLVSGISMLDKTCILTRADGEVYGITWNKVRAVLPRNAAKKIYDGKECVRYSLILGKKKINFYKSSRISYGNYDKITENTEVCLPSGIELPIAVVKTTFRSYDPQPVSMNEASAEQILRSAVNKQVKGAMSAGRILSQELRLREENCGYTLTGTVKCEEEIGITVKIKE